MSTIGTYPQNVNIMISNRFMTPPAMSGVGISAIIMFANVLENMKKIQRCRNMVMPRECTESVHSAFLYRPIG